MIRLRFLLLAAALVAPAAPGLATDAAPASQAAVPSQLSSSERALYR